MKLLGFHRTRTQRSGTRTRRLLSAVTVFANYPSISWLIAMSGHHRGESGGRELFAMIDRNTDFVLTKKWRSIFSREWLKTLPLQSIKRAFDN